jgi:hypothetical protein
MSSLDFSIRDEIEERIDELERRLNREQRVAAESILINPIQRDEFLLPMTDGPPGTGKTTVGVYASIRCILEGLAQGVLYVAPTNFAVAQAKRAFERLGVPPRDAIWLNPRERRKDWHSGVIGTRWDLSDLTPNDFRRLRRAPIIVCTPYMLGRIKKGHLRPSNINVLVDEFSQVDPALFFMIVRNTGADSNWYPRRGYALLGDPLQLPVVTTQEELLENVVEFIMSRHTIAGGLNELIVQYRMHQEICNAVNRMREELSFLRESARLQPDRLIRYRNLEERLGYIWMENRIRSGQCFDSETLREILDPSHTFVVVNTDRLPRADYEERSFTGSIKNNTEAQAAVDIAVAAYESYVRKNEHLKPTIISPYNAQVNEIKRRCRERGFIEDNDTVITAYRSQGREYPFVVVSLVRRNRLRRIGFLEDEKLRAQVYVACSRAQAKLVVLMSEATFGGKPLYERLVDAEGSRHSLLWGWS